MTRKSPIRHDVKQHTRMGRIVHRYKRGEGKAPRQAVSPARRGARFTVTLIGDRTESFPSSADSYVGALDSGLNRATTPPVAVRIRRR